MLKSSVRDERRATPVRRKTRRVPHAVLALEQIRAGFEPLPLLGPVLAIGCSIRNPQSYPTFDAATPAARLKPGAVGLVMMQRSGRAELFALPILP